MNVRTLQRAAQAALAENYQPAARYGTAFHVTPPVSDLRDLTPPPAAASGVKEWEKERAMLPPVNREQLHRLDLQDGYLAWQLANVDAMRLKIIRVAAGEEAALSLKNGGLYWIFLGAGARVKVEDTIVDQQLAIQRLFVWQAAQSSLAYVAIRSHTAFLNEKLAVHLTGHHAEATITHLTYGRDTEQTDIETRVYHEAPGTHSTMAVRTAVADRSRTIYRGLIDVDQQATATKGYQSARGLLLSRRAVIDALPQLAIRTNDVQCSHGVTTTHLDDRTLFYLRSRGLSLPQAREQALLGFYHHQLPIPASIAQQLAACLVSTTSSYATAD